MMHAITTYQFTFNAKNKTDWLRLKSMVAIRECLHWKAQ